MIARTVRKAISVTSVFFSFFTSLILRSQLSYKMDYIYIIKCLAVIIEGEFVLTKQGDASDHHLPEIGLTFFRT
jgi:hypothetical protein